MCVFPDCLRAPADRRFDWVVVAVASGGGSASSSQRRKARRRRRRKLYTSGGDGGYGEEDGDDEGDDGGDDESDEDGEVEFSDFSGEFSDAEEACESVGYVFGAPRSAYENAILSIRMEVCLDVSTCRKRHEITPPAPSFKAGTARFRTALFRTDVCNTAPPLTGLTDTLPSRFENSPGEVVTSCRCRCAVDGERRTRRRSLSSPLSSTDNIYRVVFTRVVACARPSHTCRLPLSSTSSLPCFLPPVLWRLRSPVAHISAFFFFVEILILVLPSKRQR